MVVNALAHLSSFVTLVAQYRTPCRDFYRKFALAFAYDPSVNLAEEETVRKRITKVKSRLQRLVLLFKSKKSPTTGKLFRKVQLEKVREHISTTKQELEALKLSLNQSCW